MKKSYAILISLLISTFAYISFQEDKNISLESSNIKRVVDGDTLVTFDNKTFRLANINAPEKGSSGSLESVNFLSKLINKSVDVDFISMDSTGRREVVRIYHEGKYINLRLVELGLVPKAWVEEKEIRLFAEAERVAVERGLGIWKKSDYFGCLEADINQEDEEVNLYSVCKNLSLSGLTIRDESREYLVLKIDAENLSILSGNFSGKENRKDTTYWKEQNIWNNDRDTLYIFDKENKLIYYKSYGYL